MPDVDTESRFAAVVAEVAGEPGVTLPEGGRSHRFGADALKVEGSIFAMSVQGALVVKLPGNRVRDLVAEGVCGPFRSGAGRPMKEWATVGDPALDLPLAREAHSFVRSLHR